MRNIKQKSPPLHRGEQRTERIVACHIGMHHLPCVRSFLLLGGCRPPHHPPLFGCGRVHIISRHNKPSHVRAYGTNSENIILHHIISYIAILPSSPVPKYQQTSHRDASTRHDNTSKPVGKTGRRPAPSGTRKRHLWDSNPRGETPSA